MLKTKCVVNQLGKWPNDLLSSFLTASVVISGLALVAFVSMIFCSPVTNDDNHNCCESKIFENERFFNVYFVKQAAEVWTEREFCYIEAAARNQPEMNVYVINLIRASDASNTSEDIFKIALTAQSNVFVADLSVNEFFSKSKLSGIANNLSNGLLLMAAKAYLLWNSPGIAMHPSTYCNLLTINKSRLTKKSEQDYMFNKLTVIDPNIDLQATQVHCQAFPGFLLQEISRNSTQIHSLKDALDKYCPRIDNCPEVQVLDLKSHCSMNIFDCPAVYTIGNL
ncbi:uncharacterized protein LOC109857660 isoform X2 [Pseudomyrmex gracilis]|uniref:uncharacterized protein LOC109857660 isoform X2 n=1 Tax=Pseudomyrmex gracilis TaxID=219809 RepID=UPI000995541B|nr:uncharacterized protein LOC109857660 isoform X2 [Pseudomyrmex gracilis]